MEEDIFNYSPTVMFRGTPCTFVCKINVMVYILQVFLYNKRSVYGLRILATILIFGLFCFLKFLVQNLDNINEEDERMKKNN